MDRTRLIVKYTLQTYMFQSTHSAERDAAKVVIILCFAKNILLDLHLDAEGGHEGGEVVEGDADVAALDPTDSAAGDAGHCGEFALRDAQLGPLALDSRGDTAAVVLANCL